MNVKLTYTTNIDDVPRQTANILILDGIETCVESDYSSIVCALRDQKNVELAQKLIHNLRVRLSQIDTRLQDVTNILDGYQKIRYSDKNTESSDVDE